MKEVVICLGSNAENAINFIDETLGYLGTLGCVKATTGAYTTLPEYTRSNILYTNELVVLKTSLGYIELLSACKNFESLKREKYYQAGRVVIDVDIVVYDNDIKRPKDFNARYFKQGLELGLRELKSLNEVKR